MTEDKKPHPYSQALEKVINAVNTNKFLTLKSIQSVEGATANMSDPQTIELTATIEVFINPINGKPETTT